MNYWYSSRSLHVQTDRHMCTTFATQMSENEQLIMIITCMCTTNEASFGTMCTYTVLDVEIDTSQQLNLVWKNVWKECKEMRQVIIIYKQAKEKFTRWKVCVGNDYQAIHVSQSETKKRPASKTNLPRLGVSSYFRHNPQKSSSQNPIQSSIILFTESSPVKYNYQCQHGK